VENVIEFCTNRRGGLKQAQLALHQELQPYACQKPILRTICILSTATEEIKVSPLIEVGEMMLVVFLMLLTTLIW